MKRLDRGLALLSNLRRKPDRDVCLQRCAWPAMDCENANTLIREVRSRAIHRLALRAGETVFDVACGAGQRPCAGPARRSCRRRRPVSAALVGLADQCLGAVGWLGAAAAMAMLNGCATTIFAASLAPGDLPAVDPPRYEARIGAVTPRVALVLSGGAARAFAHLGVLRVLEREGLRPDLVVGTSAGAIVGAYYAAGKSLAEIESLAARLDLPTLIDIDPVKTLLGGFGLGLAKGQRLEAFFRRSIGVPLQSLQMPFVAVATDLQTGEPVLLNHGDAPRALRASAAVPGLYEPVQVADRLLGDGQIVSPLPIGVARQLGAQVVIGVDVVYPPQNASLTNPMSVLFQTVTISTYRHLLREREQADLVIVPIIAPTADLALSDRAWLIAAGEAAAEKVLPALRAAFKAR